MVDKEKIIEMYKNGYTCTSIGNILDINRRYVSNILKQNGFEVKRGNKYKKVQIGERFNLLTILTQDKDKCECLCDCGNKTIVSTNALLTKHTKSCGCYNVTCRSKSEENVTQSIFINIERGALQRRIEFNITIKYLEKLFIRQNKECALSGVEIYFARTNNDRRNKIQTASLDRIDSSKGYIEGNVQWVHKDVNFAKGKMTQDDFIVMCKNIFYFSKSLTR